ncbi:BMP family lipoprotein [Diaminobutyricibacter sp. McL0608]|uniref:BMP family lipoprotein n=1 Tax=Leifsonia sp. McL0608 TaxID=3143537 RepID=UPI0031F2DFB6
MKFSKALTVAGGLVAVSMLFTACAAAPSNVAQAAKSHYLPCMVANTGGLNDKGFNEGAADGVKSAAKTLGAQQKIVESAQESDYQSNLTALTDSGCNIMVTVGFQLAEATKASATANPKIDYAIVDDSSIKLRNVKPISFETQQASFLAGYAAASYSRSHVIGTFGGIQIPPVTAFMDGFVSGVSYYNKQKNANVRVVGWNRGSQTGSFTGGFAANETAKSTAQSIIDQGADVLFPVGGPIYQSAGQAIRDSGKSIALIGVDTDVYKTDPSVSNLLLTSVLKGIAVGVEDIVATAGKGKFNAEPFVGTLKNGGVSIAPFHDFENKVSPDLAGELAKVKQGIIDGSISVG